MILKLLLENGQVNTAYEQDANKGAKEETNEEGFEPGTILMVKVKTVHWPIQVFYKNENMVEVTIYD